MTQTERFPFTAYCCTNDCSRKNCKEPAYRAELCRKHYKTKYERFNRSNHMDRVYAVIADLHPQVIKIGVSVKPISRASAMQTDCPVALELMGHIPGSYDLEGKLHFHLADYNIRGEWFRYEGDAKMIADAIAESNIQVVKNFIERAGGNNYAASFEDKLAAIAAS